MFVETFRRYLQNDLQSSSCFVYKLSRELLTDVTLDLRKIGSNRKTELNRDTG